MRILGSLVASLIALALCLYPLTLVEDLYPLLLLPSGAALAFLLSLITGEWVLVGPGGGLLILAYALALGEGRISFDPFVVIVAAGLLVLLDTLDLIPLLGRRPPPKKDVVGVHTGHMALALVIGSFVTLAMVIAARVLNGGPPALALPAALASLGAVMGALVLARRSVEGR